MIEGIKTNQPEVTASKSDKQLRRYSHLKICMVFHGFYLSLKLVQPPSWCRADDFFQNFWHPCIYIHFKYAITSCQKAGIIWLWWDSCIEKKERLPKHAGGSLAHVHGHTVLVALSVLSIMTIIQCSFFADSFLTVSEKTNHEKSWCLLIAS